MGGEERKCRWRDGIGRLCKERDGEESSRGHTLQGRGVEDIERRWKEEEEVEIWERE